MAQRFKIEGLRELEKALAELPRATGKNTARRALMAAGVPIERAAEANAPKRSGELGKSVETSPKLSKRQKSKHRKRSTVEVHVGAGSLPQAHTQEFGTARHAAQPFMRPAWAANKMAALKLVGVELRKAIEKAAQRLARKAARLAAKNK